jgi:hypothetical protein
LAPVPTPQNEIRLSYHGNQGFQEVRSFFLIASSTNWGFARVIRWMPASKVAASYLRPAKAAQKGDRQPRSYCRSSGPQRRFKRAFTLASKQGDEILSTFPGGFFSGVNALAARAFLEHEFRALH